MRRVSLFIALLVTAATLAVPTAAFADDNASSQVAYALEMAPGGIQTAWNRVVWPDGTVLTVEPSNTARAGATATCASGKFCAFANAGGAGTHLDFSSCPSSNSVAALPQVLSITNARSSGTVTGRMGSNIVVTVNHGATKNVTKTIDKVVCAL